MYSVLADLMVAIHFGYVAFVVVGQLVIVVGAILGWRWVRNFWFRILHFAMIAVVAIESIFDFRCPLTTWEEKLRALAGQHPSEGHSFIGDLLGRIVFAAGELPADHWGFKVGYIGFAALVGLTLWLAPPRWRVEEAKPSQA